MNTQMTTEIYIEPISWKGSTGKFVIKTETGHGWAVGSANDEEGYFFSKNGSLTPLQRKANMNAFLNVKELIKRIQDNHQALIGLNMIISASKFDKEEVLKELRSEMVKDLELLEKVVVNI